ncbi:MAG: serine protease [Planctomycetes bacterium]|nr:serine protease [Planctomycetota bacterium]
MQTASRPGVVIAFAAIIAACVAAVVGGMTALVVVHWEPGTEDAPTRERLEPGAPTELSLTPDTPLAQTTLTVPADAILVRIHATSSHGPISVRARIGDAADGPWDAESSDDAEEQDIDLPTVPSHGLLPGPVVIEVEAARDLDDGSPLAVEVRADVVLSHVEATIEAGAEWSGSTDGASGFQRTVAVRVPADAPSLRLDLADAPTDLDLHVSTGSPLDASADAHGGAITAATAESIVLDAESEPALPKGGGTIFVTVTDPALSPFSIPFRLVTTIGTDAPDGLARLPELPHPTDPRQLAVLAVVELMTDEGGGSGTLVSADGWILTARHVVEAAARAVAGGTPDDAPEIVVAMSLDAREVAKDLFLAEVVHSDRDLDLAMLRVVSGVRGTDIPEGYRFPCVKPRTRSTIYLGDVLWTLGYPAAGGTGTRASITLARGCVAGWTRSAKCNEIKTDAFVSPGSSGGAAFDDRWDLVGVPVSTQDGGNPGTVLGNIVPVEAVPKDWWR